jgi:hypothetical protein
MNMEKNFEPKENSPEESEKEKKAYIAAKKKLEELLTSNPSKEELEKGLKEIKNPFGIESDNSPSKKEVYERIDRIFKTSAAVRDEKEKE